MKDKLTDKKSSDRVLNKIVRQIVRSSNPDKIILFGSRARSLHRKDSDYDVCVLKKGIRNNRSVATKIRSAIDVFAPIDILAITPARFEQLKSKSYYVYYDIAKFGKVLYEKP